MMTMKKTIIFGNADFAEIVHYYITVDGGWDVAAFTVNQRFIEKEYILDCPVVPFESIEDQYPPDQYSIVMGIGYSNLNKTRQTVFNQVKNKGYDIPNFIHPTNTIALNSVIGEGCLIFENNTIHPFVKIGDNVVVWSNNTVGHHSVIEDHCFISSQTVFGGHTLIGERSFLGGGAIVSYGNSVGKDCILGAGAIVNETAEDGGVYQGSISKRRKLPSSKVKL